jgi:glucose-1-phosphate cytidylyltransferase
LASSEPHEFEDEMKAVILAGGKGTRISEESQLRPKPMAEVGRRPILWHIMKLYSAAGINDFIICLGYRGYVIKEYFANYFLHMSNVTINLADNKLEVHEANAEPWKVTLLDTGDETMTGGRLKRAGPFLGNEDFCFTYGDGVSDVDIAASIAFHKEHKKLATVTAIQPPGRFGALHFESEGVTRFQEKPVGDGAWVNGGFFVVSPGVLEYIRGDEIVFEREPMERLGKEGQLAAFQHHGFWQCMDTLRDKEYLESLWDSGNPPWKTWDRPAGGPR